MTNRGERPPHLRLVPSDASSRQVERAAVSPAVERLRSEFDDAEATHYLSKRRLITAVAEYYQDQGDVPQPVRDKLFELTSDLDGRFLRGKMELLRAMGVPSRSEEG